MDCTDLPTKLLSFTFLSLVVLTKRVISASSSVKIAFNLSRCVVKEFTFFTLSKIVNCSYTIHLTRNMFSHTLNVYLLLYAYESKQKQGQNPDSLNPDGTMWSFENTVWNLENEAVFRQWVNVKVDHLCNDQRMHDLIHMSYFWLYVQGEQTHCLLLTMSWFCLFEVNFCGVIIHNFPANLIMLMMLLPSACVLMRPEPFRWCLQIVSRSKA